MKINRIALVLILCFTVLTACSKRRAVNVTDTGPSPEPVVLPTETPTPEQNVGSTSQQPAVEPKNNFEVVSESFNERFTEIKVTRSEWPAPGTQVCEIYDIFDDADGLLEEISELEKPNEVIPKLNFKVTDLEALRLQAAKLLVNELLAVGENTAQSCNEGISEINTDAKYLAIGSAIDFLTSEKITSSQVGIKPDILRNALISALKEEASRANKNEDYNRKPLLDALKKFNLTDSQVGLKPPKE